MLSDMENLRNCPFCGSELKKPPEMISVMSPPILRIAYINCFCCGNYGIQENDSKLEALNEKQKATLSAFIVERSLRDKEVIILWRSDLKQSTNVTNQIWIHFKKILNDHPLPPITKCFERALINLSYLVPPGKTADLNPCHLGLLYSENANMAKFIINALINQGFLEGTIMPDGSSIVKVTPQGWFRVEELNRGILSKENRQAFIAMWFDSSMDEAYLEGISPAIKDAGFSNFRVDRQESNNQITDEIIGEIRRSKFMVADVTEHRTAVYYEAGLMHGLGRPVIFTCKEDHFQNASFDTNHYPHIIWKTPKELREKLLNRIRATIID